MLRRTCLIALVLFLAACAGPVPPLPPAATPTPAGITPITFPRDFAAHNALTEWWYVTGHLQAEDGRHFGFEFTIFRLRRLRRSVLVFAGPGTGRVRLPRRVHPTGLLRGTRDPGDPGTAPRLS